MAFTTPTDRHKKSRIDRYRSDLSSPNDSPERNLGVAVLRNAVRESEMGRKGVREWINTANFNFWCTVVGLDPEKVSAGIHAAWETRKNKN